MSAPAAIAPAAAQQEAASPLLQFSSSQAPPSSFSDLANHTQAPAAAADMHSQSLTQQLSNPASSAHKHAQFFNMPAVQQRLTAACESFSTATTALQKATQAREHFIACGSKQGGSKQLPAKLDWKLSRNAHLLPDGVPADFYASVQTTLRAIEREATDKAYDTLLAAKDKHIAFLQKQCGLREFVNTASQAFRTELQLIAAAYNQRSHADPSALSQVDFAFPLEAVATYFQNTLHSRLSAQTLAAVEATRLEQQRLSKQRADEHRSQEIVLAGAHTGQTISMLAEKEVNKQLAPLIRKVEALTKQLQPQQQRQSATQHKPTRHRAPRSDASSSQSGHTRDSRPSLKQPRIVVVVPKKGGQKRTHENTEDDDAIEQNRPSPSRKVYHNQQNNDANKRRKVTVTFPPKNGEGGDRHPRSDQQQPRSSEQVKASQHKHARQQGRGPGSDAQQSRQ